MKILKNYEEKIHFLDIIFQQDNAPVHKSKIIGNFFPRKRVEGPDPIENLWAILKQRLLKQTGFWENLEESV